ncbi:unnamed protein product [Adineta steineri]|uniref:Uncharacterized protein n=1 Tax=Adineta steineri TaxID=433720 RepID=A0A813MA35_9BILA|nr:unnamed protein product [Adineta steineri]CAF3595405.1 unnamed protein product [Adineta steineri]
MQSIIIISLTILLITILSVNGAAIESSKNTKINKTHNHSNSTSTKHTTPHVKNSKPIHTPQKNRVTSKNSASIVKLRTHPTASNKNTHLLVKSKNIKLSVSDKKPRTTTTKKHTPSSTTKKTTIKQKKAIINKKKRSNPEQRLSTWNWT